MTTLRDTFAVKVKTLRHRRNFTQEDLATKAGISMPHVSMLESAKRSPSLDVIEAIAKALDVHPATLLGGRS